MKKGYYGYLIMLALLISCKTHPENHSVKSDEMAPEKSVYDLVANHQILLTNDATFTGHTPLFGASAFLVNYNNTVYAITAKHLVGADGGVVPEIAFKDVNRAIVNWNMYPRVPVNPAKDTVKIRPANLKYKGLTGDLLILRVEKKPYHILPLEIRFDTPVKGDTFYIIGCPYSQEDCKQNIYPVIFDTYLASYNKFYFDSEKDIELSGYSGAPIVDKQGRAFALVCTGRPTEKGYTIGATALDYIKNIR